MKVGFIGLGTMGRGMAGRLQAAGHDMVVTDLHAAAAETFLAAGAGWRDSPREVAEASDVVFTSLPTPADVLAVASGPDGLLAGFASGAAWFDLSTSSLAAIRTLHADCADKGVAFLDAPVSGGPHGAASGALSIWVGGDPDVFEAHLPVLSAMSDRPQRIGDVGAGTVAKLVHNMASSAINQVVAEVMTMGVKAGLEPLALYEAMRTGAVGRMRSFDGISKRFLQGRLDPPSFQLRLAHKDARLAVELARELEVPTRLCDLVYDEITEAMNRGWGGRDAQSALLLQQERAGVDPFDADADDVDAVVSRT
ncbi:NAD(P)-dependent oxidoreductase [Cnuibacter physcomitrellae]|uniref:NAD(P)-dependent oxidoreductase n=1 Tax=Cnuibacter physcomitrellae TaxID=1619308 RepID=UPI002175CEB8|nr:NAD(P)-dependent oxidoreductase [Cnuibacter physcomitrellae]MCS5498310.1 NAD(P)-dependent oxidoreductase [Cnuibacter physcomitrellae]